MSFKPTGYDGFEYVDDPPTEMDIKYAKIWTDLRIATDDKCQRCGRSYRELIDWCPNAKLHGERRRET